MRLGISISVFKYFKRFADSFPVKRKKGFGNDLRDVHDVVPEIDLI